VNGLMLLGLLVLVFVPRFWLLAVFLLLQAIMSGLALDAAWRGAQEASQTLIPDHLFWQSQSLWNSLLRLIAFLAIGAVLVSGRKFWRSRGASPSLVAGAEVETARVPSVGETFDTETPSKPTADANVTSARASISEHKLNWQVGLARVFAIVSVVWWAAAGFHLLMYDSSRAYLFERGLFILAIPVLVGGALVGAWLTVRWVWQGFATTEATASVRQLTLIMIVLGLSLTGAAFAFFQLWPRPDALVSGGHPISNSPREFNYSRDEGWTPQMVVVPGGTFTMGAADDEPNATGPQRVVSIREFAVSKYEITFDLWLACVERGGCASNPNPHDEGWGRGDRPVINVSLEDAREYVDWLSGVTGQTYRLLSEAEWEYAARAGTTTAYWTGSNISLTQANFDPSDLDVLDPDFVAPDGGTRPVGSYPANPFGLHDMNGNVAEWVEDCWHGDYYGAPTNEAPWLSGDCLLNPIRGGSWFDSSEALRSARRFAGQAWRGERTMGFRVARTLSDE
jgi:formylglycine-generating enzyme required for sulfatase activity